MSGVGGAAVVVGAGHNGLVAALVLARAGLEVTLVESADEVGGCVWTDTDSRGIRRERGAIDHGGVRELARELGLDRHGLVFRERPTMASFLVAGEERVFSVSSTATAESFGDDGPAYREFVERSTGLFAVIDRFGEPPTPTALAAVLAGLRGGDELFRSMLSSARSVIEGVVVDPRTRAALELYASHSQIPSWAPGSGAMAMMLPASHDHPAVRPEGGSASLTSALRQALVAAGGTVRTGVAVRGIQEARAAGGRRAVVLESGESVETDLVVSTIGIPRTARLFDGGDWAPSSLRADADRLRDGQFNVSELTVSITRSDPAAALGDDAIHFVQKGLDDLRRGFGDLVAGRLPSSPWAMVADVPQDAGTRGSAVWLSSVVPLVRADGEWTPELEYEAGLRVVEAISAVLGTDLASSDAEIVVTGPLGWSRRVGGTGNPNHVDLTLDQLFGWRSVGGRGYRTRTPWLYLAGAGTHPGGGLSGSSGRAAANAVLDDLASGGRSRGLRGMVARARRGTAELSAEAVGLVAALRSYRSMRRGAAR